MVPQGEENYGATRAWMNEAGRMNHHIKQVSMLGEPSSPPLRLLS